MTSMGAVSKSLLLLCLSGCFSVADEARDYTYRSYLVTGVSCHLVTISTWDWVCRVGVAGDPHTVLLNCGSYGCVDLSGEWFPYGLISVSQ